MIHTDETRRKALEELRQLAQSRGGKCLSRRYEGAHVKHKWCCAEGHRWSAIPTSIRRGSWCGVCGSIAAGRSKASSIEDARSVAKQRGGKCLSRSYKNNSTDLKWQCGSGHQWDATFTSVKGSKNRKGTWCPVCAGKLAPAAALKYFQTFAAEKGGKLLSRRYVRAKEKLKWECAQGHVWTAVPDSVKRGTWCPSCSRIEQGARIEILRSDLQDAAKAHNGICHSTEYTNAHHKLDWECQNGHRFKMKLGHVEDGHWCPRCSAGRSERLCAAVLEYVVGREFRKSRPKWLLNERGNPMEVDGYCEKLGMAFEFHGEQHFDDVPFFHRSGKSIERQRQIDARKRRICRQRGVALLEIPISVPPERLQAYITEKIESAGMGHTITNRKKLDLDSVDLSPDNYIIEYHQIAKERGGQCLSRVYFNNHTKLMFECGEGHQWTAVPSSIKAGSWCQKCGYQEAAKKQRKHTIGEMRRVAESRGGKCLSKKYVSCNTKLEWQCAEGHRWKAAPSHVMKGRWCPRCGKAKLAKLFRLSIEDMRETAARTRRRVPIDRVREQSYPTTVEMCQGA